MRRRNFLLLVGGSSAQWSFSAAAQQPSRTRRIGVLMGFVESDPQAQSYFAVLRSALQNLGWTETNTRIDVRWATIADAASMQKFAKDLVALQPDLILSQTTPTTAA